MWNLRRTHHPIFSWWQCRPAGRKLQVLHYKVTSALEGYVGRRVFWDFRIHAKMPTRRPRERPDVLSARISIGSGETQHLELPIADHPYFMPHAVWGMPGLLIGEQWRCGKNPYTQCSGG